MRWLAVLAVSLACSITYGVEVPDACRVDNIGGRCTWASIETAGNVNGCQGTRGIVKLRLKKHRVTNDPGYMPTVRKQLDELGVRYVAHDDYKYDREALAKYANEHGAVVTIMPGNTHCGGPHSIYVTEYTDKIVRFYDPNRPLRGSKAPHLWTAQRKFFDKFWAGNFVVILPDESESIAE